VTPDGRHQPSFALHSEDGLTSVILIPIHSVIIVASRDQLTDTAKDIYRNITGEKAILVRLLMEREKASKTTQELWQKMAEVRIKRHLYKTNCSPQGWSRIGYTQRVTGVALGVQWNEGYLGHSHYDHPQQLTIGMHLFISSGLDIDSFQLLIEVQNAIQKIENRDRTDRGEIMTKV
jgi:hypothetical protein